MAFVDAKFDPPSIGWVLAALRQYLCNGACASARLFCCTEASVCMAFRHLSLCFVLYLSVFRCVAVFVTVYRLLGLAVIELPAHVTSNQLIET